jgi:5'-methylthioadenosine/S-adenosylhomocysteine nucleosidase
MILIIGSNEDDILYFVNRMNVTGVEEIGGRTKVYTGDFSRQQVVVAHTGTTMMMASMITGIIIEKYHPYLVVNVGNAHSINPKLKQGDLFLAERVYLSHVDQTPLGSKIKFGQLPGGALFTHSEDMCLNIIEMHNNREANKTIIRGFILSSNLLMTNLDDAKELLRKYYQPLTDMIAMDTEVGGIAIACQFYDVPIVCLKAIAYEVGNKEQFLTRERIGVEMTPIIGSLIGHLFLELASQEPQQ